MNRPQDKYPKDSEFCIDSAEKNSLTKLLTVNAYNHGHVAYLQVMEHNSSCD